MARYRALQDCYGFEGLAVTKMGVEFTCDDAVIPGPYMQPLDAAAIKAFKAIQKLGFKSPMAAVEDMQMAHFETFVLEEVPNGR
jgi:hypothetical protein